jgi:hypothetical protein
MIRHPSTNSTFISQRRESSVGGREDRAYSTNPTTDVVIPSVLLSALTSGPYNTHPNQLQDEEPENPKNEFNVHEVAQQLHQETSRILARSTSVSIAELARNTTTTSTRRLRKTSLDPNFGSNLDGREFSPRQTDPGRHDLSTVTEGEVLANHKRTTTNDYFGDYTIGAQGPRLNQRTSSDVSVARKARMDEPSPTHPSPLQSSNRNPSHDTNDIRISTQRPRRSTAGGSRKESIVQRSASIVLNTVDDVKQAIRRSSIYDVYEKAKQRSAELQRSRWAMLLFEYTFYLILVAFVYFVLVGLPLWKGAVYWLYWVFKHKFAVAGTWYVTSLSRISSLLTYAGPLLSVSLSCTPGHHFLFSSRRTRPCLLMLKTLIPTERLASTIQHL